MVGWRIKKDGRMQRRTKQSEGERERQRRRNKREELRVVSSWYSWELEKKRVTKGEEQC